MKHAWRDRPRCRVLDGHRCNLQPSTRQTCSVQDCACMQQCGSCSSSIACTVQQLCGSRIIDSAMFVLPGYPTTEGKRKPTHLLCSIRPSDRRQYAWRRPTHRKHARRRGGAGREVRLSQRSTTNAVRSACSTRCPRPLKRRLSNAEANIELSGPGDECLDKDSLH
jgi:hypothetical protein